MTERKKTSDAVSILRSRYIKNDPAREASLQEERINIQIAAMIYNLRIEANLTQKQLADLAGTKQSVISRLEDADYEGHSLSMLNRIAKALNHRVVVGMIPMTEERSSEKGNLVGVS
jgi:ribosome-binding protein aMBF1 (putative translation factor)